MPRSPAVSRLGQIEPRHSPVQLAPWSTSRCLHRFGPANGARSDLIIPDKNLSIVEGATVPGPGPRPSSGDSSSMLEVLEAVGQSSVSRGNASRRSNAEEQYQVPPTVIKISISNCRHKTLPGQMQSSTCESSGVVHIVKRDTLRLSGQNHDELALHDPYRLHHHACRGRALSPKPSSRRVSKEYRPVAHMSRPRGDALLRIPRWRGQ